MKNENNNKPNISRRMFLKLGLWVSGLVSAWGAFKFLSYEPPVETLEPTTRMGKPITYPYGSVAYSKEVKAWLIHERDGFYAVSSTCTHLGCTLGEEEGQFACPCHGSHFDLTGKVLQGPAIDPLPHFEVSLTDDGQLLIDRRVIVPQSKKFLPDS